MELLRNFDIPSGSSAGKQSNPVFKVVTGTTVSDIIDSRRNELREVVCGAYLRYHQGLSTNPESHFLKFPDRPRDRIIALPARDHGDEVDRAGIKWISSFPGNLAQGLPRASAVIILNDMATGFPVACLEASAISAGRTAASAALAARELHRKTEGQVLGVIGCGPIARAVLGQLEADGWSFRRTVVHDLDAARADAFRRGFAGETAAVSSAAAVVEESDLVLFATTASEPYFLDAALVKPRHTILHISLRDLGAEVLRHAQNIVDDPVHALREKTSMGLSVELHGDSLISGTLAQLMAGEMEPDAARPRIFSPFGLGVLDIAVADFVYGVAVSTGRAQNILDFY
ncbi:2,3-diaminopropionate biosynthesis protein SbnB [Kitasatospora sp. MAP5-34]|uniref:2,3-diaminopropionate biosynthesis protein SbnB n=1 Tax=Kitasatospora sp. MAP5-34 TaxID=3035102 RepID=UPI00247645DD|nr:2,3-diaminopropionate biosynthesis protein SbnB [Kitasatospora sp. MAP5-34]